MSRTTKAVPMCCITIGHQDFLMPSDKGMKLVELMQSAVNCNRRYQDRGYVYNVGEQPNVEYVSVKPQQVLHPCHEVQGDKREKRSGLLPALQG